ncbi:hypothetical protein GCM10020295_22500 [Streptomyces cinereospinus]
MGAWQAAFGAGTALGPAVRVALWSAWGGAAWLVFGAVALLATAAVAAGMRAGSAVRPGDASEDGAGAGGKAQTGADREP